MLRLSLLGNAPSKMSVVSQKAAKNVNQKITKKVASSASAPLVTHTSSYREGKGNNSHNFTSTNSPKSVLSNKNVSSNSSSGGNIIVTGNSGTSESNKSKKAESSIHFDASKAGLQLVDKAYVEQVIQEASKGSAFYEKEQKKDQIRRKKAEVIAKQALEYPKLSNAQKQAIKQEVDALEAELEKTRDLRRRFIHLDMDMFFAAVEEKRNHRLRSIPFGVGSVGMLSTTNYIARQYGVRSGMPGFIGRKLCPDLHIVPVNMEAYKRESAIVQGIAARYDPHFVSLGLDELTMDVTKYLEQYPWLTASQIATDFREEVFAKTHLTCSAGIAPTSALSKIASNVNKPNGQYEITLLTRADLLEYVRDIPLRKIPGIGYSQELQLNMIGIKTCGDLLKKKYLLYFLYKPKTFSHYLTVGLGLNEAFAHKQHEVRQSIGKESTFSEPLPSKAAFQQLFRKLLQPIHAQCVKEHLLAQQMCLVLKSRAFETQQFSSKLPCATNDLKVWLDTSRVLLAPHINNYAEFRLVGVRMQKLLTEEQFKANNYKTDGKSMEEESVAEEEEIEFGKYEQHKATANSVSKRSNSSTTKTKAQCAENKTKPRSQSVSSIQSNNSSANKFIKGSSKKTENVKVSAPVTSSSSKNYSMSRTHKKKIKSTEKNTLKLIEEKVNDYLTSKLA